MLTEKGPKVIEYNCRFGDPETQVVLPLLKSDLFTIMRAVAAEKLDSVPVEFADESACTVVLASEGYPQKYDTGFEITVDDGFAGELFIAGAKLSPEGRLLTAGGRVLCVTATAPDLGSAIEKSYANVKYVHFANAYCRRDIGQRAMLAIRG